MFNGNCPVGTGGLAAANKRPGRTLKARILAKVRTPARSLQRDRPVAVPQPEVQVPVSLSEKLKLDSKLVGAEPSTDANRETGSILSLYLREAGEVPLLKPAEEVALAARIQAGDDAARDHMIRANLRLVIKIAREYENLGMPLLDMVNEGNLGLMRAVEKFDPAKGGKLSTYASLWIRQQIRRALASQGKTIRLPVHVADRIYHLSQAELRLRSQLGREATEEELAMELKMTPERLGRLRRAAARPSSLDAPLGDDGISTVAEVVADESARDPFEAMRDGSEGVLVRKLVGHLPEREARILRFRFGLDSGQEQTLETVGRRFKLTRERIRQLQNEALKKLRRMMEDPKCFPLPT